MQRWARDARKRLVQTAFVPTMGSLHAGHMALVARARKLVGPSGRVVVSIYVNPTQFGPKEDFSKYPRDLKGDAALCRRAGVDLIFAPSDRAMYPENGRDRFSTFVVEENLSQGMEGASRPTHFRGVTTVVTKLFHMVDPDVAVFGQKDYQQAAVIQRMARDLNFRVRIVVAPTHRESDGLAMSSRNRYLSQAEREQAVVLWEALQIAKRSVRENRGGLREEVLRRRLTQWIERHPAARVDYISIFDPVTLNPVKQAGRGVHLAMAVWMGRTRLIDNIRL